MTPRRLLFFAIFFVFAATTNLWAQCGGLIMEPGFQFLSSSRGCAPFNVQIETLYLASTPGTQYFVDWGDGTPEEVYTQTNATGVVISHTYPNSPVDCGYDVTIDAENGCNPRGSVVPIETQVVVWTNDVIAIDPGVLRVCQGFAANVLFTDNSDWNCYPRATRENNEARWIQWIYGTGVAANQIPGVQVNSVAPGAYPYLDPAPGKNPIYPVLSPGEVSLPINVPVTTPADVGREFEITLKNWNQCNPYDNVLLDGNAFNPVNGDLVNGDNAPQLTTARIVIVEAPQPDFLTRLGSITGSIQNVFCINDVIFFHNQTPNIPGATFDYRWEFFDNNTGIGSPIGVRTGVTNPTYSYSTTGQKLIRLSVRDTNAAGSCVAVIDKIITISPSLIAQIQVTDLSGNVIVPDFCQEPGAPLTNFDARFTDVSTGTVLPSSQWRWEFYNENNVLVFEAPVGGGFSNTQLGPFNRVFTNKGVYRARLRIRDNLTSCESVDEVQIRVFEKPQPDFTFNRVCAGTQTNFVDASTLNPIIGEQIILREWDMSYDGVTFNKDASLDNQINFNYTFPAAGSYQVALRVTTDQGACSEIEVKNVIVDPVPNVNFTPSQTAGCSTLRIEFTNNSIAGQPDVIDRFIWEVDAGGGFVADSVQRPTDPGFSNLFLRDFENNTNTNIDYRVRLRVVTVNGCERVSAPVTITVYPGPQSGFVSLNYSPFDNNCSPVSVNFNVDAHTQSLNPTDYTWTVSDVNGVIDQTSTGTTPTYTFNFVNNTQLNRDFSIRLRASLASGCFGDSVRTIRVSPVPSSAFSIDTLEYNCEKVQLHFDATQKGLAEYEWTIIINGATVFNSTTAGDSFDHEITRSISTDQNVQIRLVTTNFANCQSTQTTQNIFIPRADNINASFTATPLEQTLPNSTVSITNNTNPGPWQYTWDFGDGTTSTSATPGSHTYATYGTYVINLTVRNNDCVQTASTSVKINPIPPVLDFSYDPASGCAPLTVKFTNLSQYADPTSYFWQFGEDEGTSRAINPTYTYYEPGVYSVTLSATNATGQTVQITKPMIIEVLAKPDAQFNLKPKIVNVPGGKLYTNNQSFGATSYLWDFGDGSTSTEFEPVHEYKTEGLFDVTLIAMNTEGCADTLKVESAVQTINSAQLLIPNAFSPNLSGPGNSAGENDVFRPIMRGVSDYQMLVFNRWGELLFETKDPEQGWDGYYQGKLCQQDVYIYKIVARSSDGQQMTRVGDIHLIR
jgi:gliding motility-associated-like protein